MLLVRTIVISCLLNASLALGQGTWISQNSGVAVALKDIEFLDENYGLAVGAGGTILRTTDGGQNWTTVTSGVSWDIYDVEIANSSLAWACGTSGNILKSVDGGLNWTGFTAFTAGYFYQVNFIGTFTGFACGFDFSGSAPILYFSVDGGNTWADMPAPSTSLALKDIEFLSPTTAYCVVDNAVYYTSNAGGAWATLTLPASFVISEIEMADATTGWIVGDNGIILKTTNGGSSWFQQTSPTANVLNSLCIVDANNVYVCASGGAIISTTDGGTTWVTNTVPVSNDLYGIHAVTASDAWASGTDGKILKLDPTTDLDVQTYEGTTSVCPKTLFDVKIGIKNAGPVPITSGTFSVYVNSALQLTYTYSGSLAPGLNEVISLGQISLLETSSVVIEYSGDLVTTNNSLTEMVDVLSDGAFGTNGPFTTCTGGVVNMYAFGGTSYKWLNATPDSTSQTQSIVVYSATDFVVEIYQSSCTILDTVQVSIDDSNCSTNAFTPNGDSKNDYFHIDQLPSGANTVIIFNRWGDELLIFQNYDNSTVFWDGKDLGGNTLTDGVYYYTVADSQNMPILKGWVQLVR